MRNGKVWSDLIDIEATPPDIPALLQATPARTYDVIVTAAMPVPRATERAAGLRILRVIYEVPACETIRFPGESNLDRKAA